MMKPTFMDKRRRELFRFTAREGSQIAKHQDKPANISCAGSFVSFFCIDEDALIRSS